MNQGSNDIRLLLVVGIAAMLMLFISLLLIFIFTQRKKLQYQNELQAMQNAQKNQLIEAAVRSEEIERHRIAEELHDEIGALLGSSSLHFYSVNMDDCDEQSQRLYQKGRDLLDEGINKIRSVSHSLHSSILQEFGLNEAISHFCSKISHESIVEINTTLDNSYPTQVGQNDISIYRIVQEFIHNITKHARATKIFVRSIYLNKTLMLTITHNGNGLTQSHFEELRFKKDGLGLKNIQNRIILLKANLKFSHHAGGYAIDISVPID
ncbi:sensor histidine kinase [Mucilaginibacter lappiensis]|uniref:histidine kinase n=1 Tax=Mucilaginibacter lappiensis TaxID=354630 RepID=A0A841J8I9_9SPHI|nr:histidine kinase [Mucilaginibacter lappiensis]MBB6127403.1 signal transduction histidine kinase [Mucilaginibacter lappiensis]